MIPFDTEARSALPATVLFVLGWVDLLRGVLHTFLVSWSAKTFARMDLSVARQDQLTLLGAFGISNLLTGVIFMLVSIKAGPLSDRVLLAIPCAYAIGFIGIRTSGVKPRSAFYGKYFILAYLGTCLMTVLLSRLHP